MVISFLEHRSLFTHSNLFEKVEKAILENADFENKVSFFCGGYGDFDELCAQVCREVKKKRKNCEVIFVPHI